MVTIGIKPSRPDTGYRYIKYDNTNPGDVPKVTHFKEKPSLEDAQIFLNEGSYVWNARIFIRNVESTDYAVMEHAGNVFTIPSEFDWSDLGTWTSLFDTAEKSNNNNVVSAKNIKI